MLNANIFHIAPTTFHGIKRGIDIKIRHTGTPQPLALLKLFNPSGI